MSTAKTAEDLVKERRSVFPKEFEDGTITREEIEKLLNVARYAPTHKLTQPWRFVVVGNDHTSDLAEVQANAFFEKKGIDERSKAKAEKFRTNAQRSSAVIAVIMKRDSQERIPTHEEEWAVACAVQNMHILASQMQIGMYWSTGAAVNFPEVRQYLNLNQQDRHMGWLYLGRFTGKKELYKERMTVEEISEFRW